MSAIKSLDPKPKTIHADHLVSSNTIFGELGLTPDPSSQDP